MYDSGKDISQNFKKSLYWYTKTAEQGDIQAQANLGSMHGKGHGVSQDYILAYVWSYLAALQGNETGKQNRDHSAAKMSIEQIVEAE